MKTFSLVEGDFGVVGIEVECGVGEGNLVGTWLERGEMGENWLTKSLLYFIADLETS